MTLGFVMAISWILYLIYFSICTKGFSQLIFVYCKSNVIFSMPLLSLSFRKSLNNRGNYHSLRSTRALFLFSVYEEIVFSSRFSWSHKSQDSQSAKNQVVNSQNDRKFPFRYIQLWYKKHGS